MNRKRRNRMVMVGAIVALVGVAVGLALVALQENMNLFYSPSQVAAGEAPAGHNFRLGGLVKEGSVARASDSLQVRFDLSDGANAVAVSYTGILPDLFREGQGIVAQGKLRPDGIFEADEVLAKHDENYMPPEVQEALQSAQQAGLANPHGPTADR